MNNKILKKAAAFFVLVMCLTVITMTGCMDYASRYSEEKHKERISKLVKKRYMTEESEYTSFEVYPLYNENDELKFFVVEFEPYGYVYVKINEKSNSLLGLSMYMRESGESEEWFRYEVDENSEAHITDKYGYEWIYKHRRLTEIQDDGEPVKYKDSHFKVAETGNERRYFIEIECLPSLGSDEGFVPAVKRGEKYLNLVSMQEFVMSNGEEDNAEHKRQAISDVHFFAGSVFKL